VRLFVERVQDVQPDFQLTAANGRTVIAICRRLDALPLALELAASWMKVLTAEDLLHRLEQDALQSTVAPRDLPERQQTMNAAVAWSYQLLSPNEQRAFRRFGALAGRFSVDAACAVLAGHDRASTGRDQVLDALASLIDKSLLLRTETSVATRPLYQVLETVRAYAARELTASGERDAAFEGLARYCTSQASLATEALAGPAQGHWLGRVHEDLENYRGAMTWLIEHGRSTEACDIAWGLLSFWFIRGRAAEGLWWYQAVLNLPSLPPVAESRALVGAAMMLYLRRELDRARTAAERGIALAGSAGDKGLVATAEILLGHVGYAVGEMIGARDRFAESLEKFRTLAIPWGVGSALTGLAAVALALDDHREAERLLDEATSVLPRAGPWYWSLVLSVRAIVAVRRGDADTAIALVRETLTHIRELHDKFAFVHALVPLAAAAVLKGDDAWAARILGARDEVAERTGAAVVDNSVRDLQGRVEADVRDRLSNDRWAEEYAAGRLTSMDSLLKEIDSALPSPTR
jgi:tetratricopeptide (TPR) repeat protein